MRCIFLDVDGVLNTYQSREELGWKSVSPYLVGNLNEIVRATGAKIVISSTWRLLDNIERLRVILSDAGLENVDEVVIDMTPRSSPKGHYRGFQIQDWLDAHPEVTKFVILDDDSDMEHLIHRLVRCCGECGLSKIKTEWAINLLTKDEYENTDC
jgi:hypothetical protein